MVVQDEALLQLQQIIWQAKLPLEIRLSSSESRIYDRTDPYLIAYPRLSYLPQLLPRLHAFFSTSLIADPDIISSDTGYFTHESVPLKWHLPLGLLYDTYVLSTADIGSESSSTQVPFKLTLHFSPPSDETSAPVHLINPTPIVLHDSFINSVKEADFLRSGTAKPIMSLSAADSKALWSSTQENDLGIFGKVFAGLLPTKGQMRNIPFRVYLPSSSSFSSSATATTAGDQEQAKGGQIRVLQSQIPPFISASSTTAGAAQLRSPSSTGLQPQTLGSALHTMIPSLFPSRRTPILARPILHGAQVPMGAQLEDLARWACYADGWLSVVIAMNG